MSYNSGNHAALLVLLLCTCAQSVEKTRGETVPFVHDYCIKQHSAHFPLRCANPQRVHGNGPEDNGWGKK